MANDELVKYIDKEIAKQVPVETIISTLGKQGWPETDIREAFTLATGQPKAVAENPILPVKPTAPKHHATLVLIILGSALALLLIGVIVFALHANSIPAPSAN